MDKQEYMDQLKQRLRRLPKEDFAHAVEYFEEYFAEAGAENEAKAIEDLGSPKEAADQIIQDMALKLSKEPVKDVRRGMDALWVALLAIFVAPLALPLVLTGVILVVCAVIVAWSLLLALLIATGCAVIAGPIVVVAGFTVLTKSIPVCLTCIGMGLVSTGLGAACTYGMYHLCRRFLGWSLRVFAGIIQKGGRKHA